MRLATSAAALIFAADSPHAAESSAPDASPFPASMRRVLFLGDSITYDGRFIAYFEAWLAARFPERPFDVINLGLPSEAVSGLTEEGHADGKFARPHLAERLERVLQATTPDLVVACYGMNCGIYQSFDKSRFQKYQDGMDRLHAAVEKSGARLLVLTPPPYDHLQNDKASPTYNDGVLRVYSKWLVSKRDDGWDVLDLHGAMSAELRRRRAHNPKFTFQPDGVHPDETGHWFMAALLIGHFGDTHAARAQAPEAMLGVWSPVLPLVHERMSILRDAWLTATGSRHPFVPAGLPLEQAQSKYGELTRMIEEKVRTLTGE